MQPVKNGLPVNGNLDQGHNCFYVCSHGKVGTDFFSPKISDLTLQKQSFCKTKSLI